MSYLTLKNVTKRFDKTTTIDNVNLNVNEGEFVVFVGPSGCGKSTLLRLIAGLEDITEGTIEIDGKIMNDVKAAKRGVSMVFQSYALYPHMTVRENMGFGLKMLGEDPKEIERKVEDAAKSLQLEKLLDRKPKALSGGQRQRVAIGRSIVRKPNVFLFDEPLSNLDAELRAEMRLHIAKLHKTLKNTMVYVTHDQVEAMTLADKIVVLRDGKIEQVGSPMELYNSPVNEFVAGFIGSPKMNFLDMTVLEATNSTLKLAEDNDNVIHIALQGRAVQELPSSGDKVTLGVRPEHVSFGEQGNIKFQFSHEVTERLGSTGLMIGRVSKNNSFRFMVSNDFEVPSSDFMVSTSEDNVRLFNAYGHSIF